MGEMNVVLITGVSSGTDRGRATAELLSELDSRYSERRGDQLSLTDN